MFLTYCMPLLSDSQLSRTVNNSAVCYIIILEKIMKNEGPSLQLSSLLGI